MINKWNLNTLDKPLWIGFADGEAEWVNAHAGWSDSVMQYINISIAQPTCIHYFFNYIISGGHPTTDKQQMHYIQLFFCQK